MSTAFHFPWQQQQQQQHLFLGSHPTFCMAAECSDLECDEKASSASLRGLVTGIDVNQIPASDDQSDDIPNTHSPGSSQKTDTPSPFLRRNDAKRDREWMQELNDRICEVNSRGGGSDEEELGCNPRKKLRLSKEQSAFLEERFKEQSTLNPVQKQKQALAMQLCLTPRQVEVWFQNRRARTKLKQTEVDCELLKRCCENLTEENRRLHKELQELRAMKAPQLNHFFMPLPATTLVTICPSCETLNDRPNSKSFTKYTQSSAA